MTSNLLHIAKRRQLTKFVIKLFFVFAGLFIFFLSLKLISASLSGLGMGFAEELIAVTGNPFSALFIGLLVTAIIQSSSTTTAMIVLAVVTQQISFDAAVFMVIGANVGTTLTSTLVALSFINEARSFRRALTAAFMHDLFNIIMLTIWIPLEWNYHLLSTFAASLAQRIEGKGFIFSSRLYRWFGEVMGLIVEFIERVSPHTVVTLLLSVLLLFGCIKFIGSSLYRTYLNAESQEEKLGRMVSRRFFRNDFRSFMSGFLLTGAVQSSSFTTSLVIPFAAKRIVNHSATFSYIAGANLGTTITALIASLYSTQAAIAIAFVHLLFNLSGVFLTLLSPVIRQLMIIFSIRFARLISRHRIIGFVYMVLLFFLIPFSLIATTRERTEAKKPIVTENVILREN